MRFVLYIKDPLLKKQVKEALRSCSYLFEEADYFANALEMLSSNEFQAIVIEREPLGLPSADLTELVHAISPATTTFIIGKEAEGDFFILKDSLDSAELKIKFSGLHKQAQK